MKSSLILGTILVLGLCKVHEDTQEGDIPYVQTQWWFDQQRLDHSNPNDERTWSQRYWSVDQYFDKNKGAVLLLICGEYTCPGVRSSRLYPIEQAKKFGALVLVLEHRYYGNSMPLGDVSLELQNLKYLSVRQALDDFIIFIKYIKENKLFGVSSEMPWIAIGGSYPGAVAAWLRYQYPHYIQGALASSAVVNSIVDFPEFDGQIYDSSIRSGQSCTTNLQAMTTYVESQLDGTSKVQFKTKFGCEQLNDREFLFMFADVLVNIIQYGGRTKLCSDLEGKSVSAQIDYVANHVQNDVDIREYGSYYLKQTTYDAKNPLSSRQWMYQCCSELGWWQTSPATNSMRSSRIDIEFYKQFCKDIFGKTEHGSYLWPDGELANTYFGGKYLNIDKLILTNGVEDPWKHASLLQPYKSLIVREIDCVNCAHCVELYTPRDTDSQDLKNARIQIDAQFEQWIGLHYQQHISISE